jgi:hypothetical protein
MQYLYFKYSKTNDNLSTEEMPKKKDLRKKEDYLETKELIQQAALVPAK